MDSLLRHMVDMTGHRDHTMLDISVISAVQELASASRTRVLSIATLRGQKYLRPRAIICTGEAARMDDMPDTSLPGEPITNFPALASCIDKHETLGEDVAADGTRVMWLPIWFGDKCDTCLEITHSQPFTADT
jgi:hypothetical protein